MPAARRACQIATAPPDSIGMTFEIAGATHRDQLRTLVEGVLASPDLDTAVVEADEDTYVQFTLFGGRDAIRIEAIDRERWTSRHMSAGQVECLRALGFEREPTNFVLELRVDTATPRVVGELLARTLHEAYGVADGADLGFQLVRSLEP